MNAESVSSFNAVTIRFNGITHLRIKRAAFVAFQSWIEGDGHYCVEVALTGGSAIMTEYDTRERWEWVIGELDRHL